MNNAVRDYAAMSAELSQDMTKIRAFGQVVVVPRMLKETPSTSEIFAQARSMAEAHMGIITAYLSGDLPADIAAEIESMLEDPVGQLMFGSVVAAWRAPDAGAPVTDADVDTAWSRFRARLGKGTR